VCWPLQRQCRPSQVTQCHQAVGQPPATGKVTHAKVTLSRQGRRQLLVLRQGSFLVCRAETKTTPCTRAPSTTASQQLLLPASIPV
jgi:hypothetical protein